MYMHTKKIPKYPKETINNSTIEPKITKAITLKSCPLDVLHANTIFCITKLQAHVKREDCHFSIVSRSSFNANRAEEKQLPAAEAVFTIWQRICTTKKYLCFFRMSFSAQV